MKKSLLTAMLVGVISLTYCVAANAATVTFTKPTVKVNTSQEESAFSKKMKEIEQKQNAAKAQQAQREKDAKAKQDQIKKDIEKAQNDAKAKQAQREKEAKARQDQVKKDIEKAKSDAKARQQQRANAFDNFKKSFQY